MVSGLAEQLKEIVTVLQQKQPGFYFVVNQEQDKALFIASCGQTYTQMILMKKFQEWLQEEFQLRSGGNNLLIQGGGVIPTTLTIDTLEQWLRSL